MVSQRSVIVTGGLGGIGLAVARAFAGDGARILLVDQRTATPGQIAVLRDAGAADVRAAALDVADEDAVERAVATARDAFGGVDVIVNVAGMMIYRPIADLTGDDWRRLLDVNLLGAAFFVREGLRHMAAGGAIVNVASVHARRTAPDVAPYAAAKAALVSLTRSAAIEGKPLGIRVNAVLPGAVDTAMLRDSPNIRSGAEVVDPADVAKPDAIAGAVQFLASPAASFITGEDLVVDGGRMGRL